MEIETRGEQTRSGWWRDVDGFVGPIQPGLGPRTDPKGEFPTGPAVGTRMPDVRLRDIDGHPFDLHRDRGTAPAVFVFFRSAVW